MTGPTEDLIGKIQDQRFDGYTENMLADQIEQVRSGPGTGSMSAAVDALQAVATALDETDHLLRTELGKLGLAWSSNAAQQAMTVFADHAAFAADSNDKIVTAAEAGFALGEAFTRTLHRLPDPATLRAGAGGLGFGDFLGSLVGYETDQAERVKAAQLARSQAVDALNAYARDTGESLSGIEPLADPETFVLDGAGDAGASGDDTAAFGSLGATTAALAGPGAGGSSDRPMASVPVAPYRTDAGAACAPTASGFAAPAPSDGQRTGSATAGGAPEAGQSAPSPTAPSSTAPSSTAPSSTAPSSGAVVGGAVVGGGSAGAGAPRPAGQAGAQAGTPAGGAVAGGTQAGSGTSDSAASAGAARTGSGAGASGGPGGPGSGVRPGEPARGMRGPIGFTGGPGITDTDAPLAKGKLFGVNAPAAPGGASGLGPGFGAHVRPSVGGELAGGAAALGAAGAAAAGDGDRERRARGFGKEAEVDGRPLHEFPIGDIDPEVERDARNVERIEPQDVGPDEPVFLQQAAPQDGDGPRVRSYGIDDVDLFSDERMVARDVIDSPDRAGPES